MSRPTFSAVAAQFLSALVRRLGADVLTVNEEIGVSEALRGGNDGDGAGGDPLDFGDRHRWRGLGGEAPAQDGPAQTQGEPDPDQPVTTGRLDSGT